MVTTYWQPTFREKLEGLLDAYQEPRVAVLGIGNELNGDDAAGIVFAHIMLESGFENPHFLVISAGTVPENFTGLLRLFAPDLVFLVDAARMSKDPGTACLLDFKSIGGCIAFTHTLPLNIFANYLADELGCKPVLVGIQPEDISMGMPLSSPVRATITALVYEFSEIFRLQSNPSWSVNGDGKKWVNVR